MLLHQTSMGQNLVNSVGWDDWEQYQCWAISCGCDKSPKPAVFGMIFAEVVYVLWMERNIRIFEKVFGNGDSIAREIAYVSDVRAPVRLQQPKLLGLSKNV